MGEDEIGVEEGCIIQLTTGPRGGQNYGDGWWEGQFFPPLYTRLLLASLPTARRVRLPLNVPAYLAALFRRSFVCGEAGREILWGRDRRTHVLPFSERSPPRSPSLVLVSPVMDSSPSWTRFDVFTPHPWIHGSQT